MMSKNDASYFYKELLYIRQPGYVLILRLHEGNINLKVEKNCVSTQYFFTEYKDTFLPLGCVYKGVNID